MDHQCSLCQSVLTSPVTATCGHSFCMKCIKGKIADTHAQQSSACTRPRRSVRQRITCPDKDCDGFVDSENLQVRFPCLFSLYLVFWLTDLHRNEQSIVDCTHEVLPGHMWFVCVLPRSCSDAEQAVDKNVPSQSVLYPVGWSDLTWVLRSSHLFPSTKCAELDMLRSRFSSEHTHSIDPCLPSRPR